MLTQSPPEKIMDADIKILEVATVDEYPVQPDHDPFLPVTAFTPEYISLLKKMQDRISNPRKEENFEGVVKQIQKTCLLDVRPFRRK